MTKWYPDAYLILQTKAVTEITSSKKLDQLIRQFQKNYLKAWDYHARLKRHLLPVALMNELLKDLDIYLQQIQQRKELKYNDEKMHMPVPSKIRLMMEENNRINSRLKGISHFCRLQNDDFITTAVHMAEYWGLDDLYVSIAKDRNKFHSSADMHPTIHANNSKMSDTITVFISYSWDNESHKRWVMHLANKLTENGIYVILDRYDLNAGKQMTHFMENSVNNANKVLLIMTPIYKDKADNRTGGVGYECSMITQELYLKNDNDKFIPIRREGSYNDCAPKFLSSYISHDMSNDDTFEKDFELLLRLIYNEPEIVRPALGKKPTFGKQTGPISFNSVKNEKEVVKPLTLEEQHQNLMARIEEKRNIINLQHSSTAIESAKNELSKFKKYFNERGELLGKKIFDRYSHYPFNYAIHKAHIGYGEYLLECEFQLPGFLYDAMRTTQDVLLTLELSKTSGDIYTKKSLETEQRLFYYTPESPGWALPSIHDHPTNKELQVLFRTRYGTEYYNLDNPLSTELLIDVWLKKLLSYSSEAIERYI